MATDPRLDAGRLGASADHAGNIDLRHRPARKPTRRASDCAEEVALPVAKLSALDVFVQPSLELMAPRGPEALVQRVPSAVQRKTRHTGRAAPGSGHGPVPVKERVVRGTNSSAWCST